MNFFDILFAKKMSGGGGGESRSESGFRLMEIVNRDESINTEKTEFTEVKK